MAANVEDVIMLLGDSLTQGGWDPQGFAQKLSYAYQRKLDVLNRGMSGYNSEWIRPIFEQCFATQHEQHHVPKVRLLTIWLGANDAALPGSPQHVSLSDYAANLTELVRIVTSPSSPRYSPDTRILLLTPPPINTHQWAVRQAAKDPPKALDRKFEVTQAYAAKVLDVGKEVGVPVVDLWTTLWDACGRKEEQLSQYLYDGLHLNEQGYAIAYDEIIKAISANYPELHYDKLKPVFPYWDRIDLQNLPASLAKGSAFDE
ncbi:SGNH hydrolase [Laetiporus sulphureus 93-53]|uniref:SGNH hydrolase n=1 Tax=Laetiporus sulphureus 93-53 TaxID=1314785 RepID=A0A165H3M1_9APHY|nr:SGNH hydrolase [Laetiporus sulphureus 93-53]KZT11198.1 SGNH hydrolase [Laetiporus sulphureus 93-53]